MHRKSGNFSEDDIRQMATTPAGKELIGLLKQADNSQLQSALQQAASGNMAEAKNILAPLLRSPRIRELIAQLGGDNHGSF